MIRQRLRSRPMAMFWIGSTFSGTLVWVRDTFGPTLALIAGAIVVVAVDRWMNGPMNDDDGAGPGRRDT